MTLHSIWQQLQSVLRKDTGKNGEGWNVVHGKWQLPFLTAPDSSLLLHNHYDTTVTPSTFRSYLLQPNTPCETVFSTEVYTSLDICLLNTRAENSSWCLYSRKVELVIKQQPDLLHSTAYEHFGACKTLPASHLQTECSFFQQGQKCLSAKLTTMLSNQLRNETPASFLCTQLFLPPFLSRIFLDH